MRGVALSGDCPAICASLGLNLHTRSQSINQRVFRRAGPAKPEVLDTIRSPWLLSCFRIASWFGCVVHHEDLAFAQINQRRGAGRVRAFCQHRSAASKTDFRRIFRLLVMHLLARELQRFCRQRRQGIRTARAAIQTPTHRRKYFDSATAWADSFIAPSPSAFIAKRRGTLETKP